MQREDFRPWVSSLVQTRHILAWFQENHPEAEGKLLSASVILTDPLSHLYMLYKSATESGVPFPSMEEVLPFKEEDDRYHLALNRGSEEGDIWRMSSPTRRSTDLYWEVSAVFTCPEDLPAGGMFYVQEDFPMVELSPVKPAEGWWEGTELSRVQEKEKTLQASPFWTRWPREYLHKLPRNVNGREFTNPLNR